MLTKLKKSQSGAINNILLLGMAVIVFGGVAFAADRVYKSNNNKKIIANAATAPKATPTPAPKTAPGVTTEKAPDLGIAPTTVGWTNVSNSLLKLSYVMACKVGTTYDIKVKIIRGSDAKTGTTPMPYWGARTYYADASKNYAYMSGSEKLFYGGTWRKDSSGNTYSYSRVGALSAILTSTGVSPVPVVQFSMMSDLTTSATSLMMSGQTFGTSTTAFYLIRSITNCP